MFGKIKRLIASVLAVTMLITLAPSQLMTVMADTSSGFSLPRTTSVYDNATKISCTTGEEITLNGNGDRKHSWEVKEGDKDGYSWTNRNNKNASITFSKAGTYKIEHSYKWNGDSKHYYDYFVVTVTEASATTTTLYVYMYGKDNQIEGTLNASGWYTIGYVEVDGTVETTDDWKTMNDTIRGYLATMESLEQRWEPNKNISLNNIKEYDLHLVTSGADDYVKDKPAYHLDLKPGADVQLTDVTINYVDADGNAIAASEITTGTVGNEIDLSEYAKKEIKGYTFNASATTKSLSTYPKYTIAESNNIVNLVYGKNVTPVETVKVAVYATDGSKTGKNAKLESSLVISHKQDDGYYPIGVIEVPKTLVSGNSPYINSSEDWETIKAAIKEISTKELTGSGTANAGNKIKENLDKVQADLGYGAGTWRTAMFDWNGTSANISGEFKYHLDLRFATNLLTVKGVYEQNNGTFVEDSDYLVQVPYLTGENTTEPTINVEGYEVVGYYSDKKLTKPYTFGNKITSDQTVYVKLKKIEATYTINYYLNNTDNTVTVKDSFTKSAKYGDVITLSTADKTKPGYTFKSADKESLTIGKDSNVINVYFYKNVTLTANSKTDYKYDKTAKTVEGFTVSGALVGYASDFSDKVTAKRTETNAGTYDVTFSSGAVGTVDNTGKYIVTGVTKGTLTIAKADATVTVTSTSKTFGQDDPTFTGTISGLCEGDSLGEISYSRTNKTVNKVGKYENVLTATVPENKNYNVKVVNGDFEIVKAGTMTVSGTDVKVPYDGEVHGAAATSNITNGTTIYYSTDGGTTWSEEYPTLKNVGKYTVKVKAVNDNYSDATNTYTIEVIKKSVTITVADQSKKYGETDPANSYTLSNALINSNDLGTITYDRVSGENVGTYAINALYTANANYDVTVKKGTLTINKATSLTVAPTLTAENRTKVYDGTPLAGPATVTGAIGTDTIKISYSVDGGKTWNTTIPSITNVGTVTVIAKAENPNYETATTEYTLTVTPATTTITANGYTGTYDGDAHVGTITPAVTTGTTLTYAIVTNEVVGEYTSTVPERTDVGTTTVSVKAVNPNYEDAYATYTITVNARPVTISAVAADKTYGTDDPKPFKYNITSGSLVNADDLGTISVSRTNDAENAGVYDDVLVVNYTPNTNYTVTTVPADFTIKKASGMTLTVNGYEGTYDGKAHSGTAVSDKEGSTIEYSTDGTNWSTTAPSITNVGETTVTVRATNNNYETVETSYKLKVNPKAVTIRVENATKVYGEADPTFTGVVTGLVGTDTLGTVTYYRANAETDTAVGTYIGVLKASYTSNSNYKVTVDSGNFTITAADSNKLGLAVTNYSGTYDGASHGTTASVDVTEGTKIEYSTDGTNWSETVPTVTNVTNGKVTVQVRATNSNYTTATASYTLEVTPAEVTVTADNKSKVYGEADPIFTAQVSGLVNGEAESLISYKLNRESGENVDKTYTITPSGDELQGNYKVTFATGKLTITPKSIGPESNTNVTAENPENVVYNGTEQKQKVVVKDDDKTLVEGTDYELSYSEDTTNVGTVTVTVKGKGNYTGSKTVTYQITQKSVTVTADNKAKIFGETDPELTYRVEGLVGNDNSSIISVKSIEREKGETVVEGGYPITISGEESQGNYIVSYVNGIFTINPKTIEDPDKDNPGEYPDDYNGIKVGTIDDVTYTGDSQKLVPSIPGLVEGTDYTITYSTDTTNAGTVTVTVKGIGNYTGTVTRTYNINKRVVTLTSASAGKVFDGTALTAQSVTVSGQGFAKNEGEGVTYIFSGAQTGVGSIANAFEYTLNTAVINPNNYVITVVYGTLTVAAAPVTEPDTPTPTAVTHTLTIHYVDEAGNAVAPDYVGTFVTGSSYLVASPVVLGYTPQFASVASPEGGMPDMDVEVSVLYTPNVPVVPQDNGTPEVTTNVPDNGGAGNVPNDAGVQAVDNNANVNDANTEIPDADVPQGALSVDENGNVEIVEIEDEETALAANTAKAWALINLLAMIATAVLGIVLLVLALKKKKEEEEDENAVKAESEENEDEAKEKNKKLLKLCGLIPAIASVIVFFLTENMKNPMAYVDKWTVLMVILLVVEIVLAVLSKKKKEEKEDDTQAPQEA